MKNVLASHIQRASTYKGLSECFCPPDEGLLATLGELDEQADGLFARLTDLLAHPDGLDALKVDHAKLFVGPFSLLAPPYGAVYLENNAFMGDSTMDARNLYRQEGLQIVLKEAPDHIVMELEFMAFLVIKESEEVQAGRADNADCYRQKQAGFLNRHLGAWIAPFAECIETHALTEFYRLLASVTREFVNADRQLLSA